MHSADSAPPPRRGLRVLHLRTGDGMYGAEKVVLTLARAQRARGDDAQVLCIERPGRTVVSDRFRAEGLPVHRVAFGGRFSPRALLRLRAALRALAPDVIHAHDYKADLALVALRPFLAGRPALVATNHLWTRETPVLRLYERLDALGMRHLDRVVGVSSAVRDEMRSAGVPERKLSVVVNGLEYPPGPPRPGRSLRAELGLAGGTALVGFVGRLSVQKGLGYLLEAVARLPALDACFALAGDGPLHAPLQAELRARGLERRVVLLGRRDDVPSLMRQLDLLVLPSVREGTPLVLLEAMALGTPVLASDVGGVRDVVAPGRTGLLFPSGDVGALCAGLERALGRPAERQRMARRARDEVRARFSAAAMAAQYDTVYDQVLRGLRRSRPRPAPGLTEAA